MMWSSRKKRTKLGKFLDRNGFTQQDLQNIAKLSQPTVTNLQR